MALKIFLAATLRKYVAGYDASKGHVLSVNAPIAVRDVARRLAIPEEEVKLIMVDGIHAGWETILRGDERVAFFPPVGGG